MLKLANKFHDFKCGEIFCITSTTYRVACCLCGSKVLFGEFPQHFQALHLSALDSNNETVDIIKKEEDDGLQIASMCAQKVELSDDSEIEDEKPIDLADLQKDKDERTLVVYNDGENAYDVNKDENSSFENDNDDDDDDTWFNQIDSDKGNTKNMEKNSKNKLMPFPCADCDRGYNTKRSLRWHIRLKHDPVPTYADAQTDNNTNSDNDSDDESVIDPENDKKDSSKNGMPFPCNKCDRGYNTKRSLRWHMRLKHDPTGKKRKSSPKYKCDQCGSKFSKEEALTTHKFKHTGIKCDICGKEFTQIGNLRRHKVRHTRIRAHKCEQCEMSFFTIVEKRAHMLSHTKQKPHVCELCGKAVRLLNDHIRRQHTGERPAKCDVCGKRFFSGHEMNMHAVTHTTERPFACDICGSTFQLKKALRVHKKVHSNVRNHECKICGKAFAQSGGLHAHMRSHDAAQKSSRIEASVEFSNIF